MPLYDYSCDCGPFEALNKVEQRSFAQCPKCGKVCKMKISAPHVRLDGTDPDFPGEWAKWEKKREQKMKVERKREDYL